MFPFPESGKMLLFITSIKDALKLHSRRKKTTFHPFGLNREWKGSELEDSEEWEQIRERIVVEKNEGNKGEEEEDGVWVKRKVGSDFWYALVEIFRRQGKK